MNQCRVDMNQENIISTFASNRFYGDIDACIREFLANAVDACNTRQALEWSWGTEFLELQERQALRAMRDLYHPKIVISYDSASQRLTFEDNGIGMNADDIEKYVSKVGCSYYTSEEFALQQLKYEPVGEFGIGMLSGFMIARAILIESKKDKGVNTAWNISEKQSLEPITAKWMEGAETIEYITSRKEESGTKVTLLLRPQFAGQIQLQGLADAVQRYMLYQKFPIQIICDSESVTLSGQNWIFDNPFADILGIITIPVLDELMEGCIWIYNSKHKGIMGGSSLYQQGFLVADEKQELEIKPEWLRHMTYHLNLKKKFLTLRLSRDGVAHDGKLMSLREQIGQIIVKHFEANPLALNQYLSSGSKPVLTEYENEMELLGKAVSVDIFLKGQEIELPIDTIIHGFEGKVIRIAFFGKALFQYYRLNYFPDFKQFQKEYKLVVFERNRDVFCQMLAPYMRSMHYMISECPGIIYEGMVADFHMIRSVVPYYRSYRLHPPKVGYDNIFCLLTDNDSGRLELTINEEHRLAKMISPVKYHSKVHAMVAVILENIKQRIINTRHSWDKIVDFGGQFVDDWDGRKSMTVQSIGCLEDDFAASVNEFIDSRLTTRERMDLGLMEFEFRKEDFINWWYASGK